MLHRIWLGFFLVAFISSLVQWLWVGDAEVFQRLVSSLALSGRVAAAGDGECLSALLVATSATRATSFR